MQIQLCKPHEPKLTPSLEGITIKHGVDARYLFLDTDYFLHYKSPDQLDWLKELGAKQVVLLIAPVVLRQLQDKKDSSESRKLRKRAGLALKRLDRYLEQDAPVIIREGVELQFISHDPQLDFPSNGLSRQVYDDWLIANIMEFLAEAPGRSAILISGDIGLKVKAKTHNISVSGLAETYRLPEEEDALAQRNRELEEQLRRFTNQLPTLELVFEGGESYVPLDVTRPPVLTHESIARILAELRNRLAPLQSLPAGTSFADALTSPSPEAIAGYNAKLERYFSNYEKYLQELEQALQSKHRHINLHLYMENSGGSPADDVDVYMHFPDGLDVLEEEQLTELPGEPVPPARPEGPIEAFKNLKDISLTAALAPNFDFLSPASLKTVSALAPRNVSSPKIRKSNSYEVTLNVKSVKHGFMVSLGEFHIRFTSWDTVSSFAIDYSLHASNLPKATHGSLNVVIRVVNA